MTLLHLSPTAEDMVVVDAAEIPEFILCLHGMG
jgi:hypothetical protein